MILIYNLLFPLLLLIYLPFYAVHCIRRGGLTRDFWERFGIFPSEVKARLRKLKSPVWIHAVSVGETVEALSFIRAWRERHPQEEIVFSCGTSTGFATARNKLPEDVVAIYCPMDCWWMIWHALNLIRPRVLAILEVEIWPNLILQTARRGAKVVLVNGRMSDKSSRGYAKWRCVFGKIFSAFSAVCVQTPEDAARLERVMGADQRIATVGTVKFDQVPDREGSDVAAVLDSAFGTSERLLFCVGSTHPGEEEIILEAYKNIKATHPALKLALVPRHAERGPEVTKLLESYGLTWQSVQPLPGACAAPVDVLLVNTTGQLMNFYACSHICFVGKSLRGQNGGHNIIEPAIFGKAVIYGEHTENFRQVDAIFREEQAGVVVRDDEDFQQALLRLVEDAPLREQLGKRARATVDKYRGAINRTLDIIDKLA